MARQKDSIELKKLKQEATIKFVTLIESKCSIGPKQLEEKLGIGDSKGGLASGIIWCAYRRGARSMSPGTVNAKVKIAIKQGLISPVDGEKFLTEADNQLEKIHMLPMKSENYVYDPQIYDLTEFSGLVEQLIMEAQRLATHYPNKNLADRLKPIQALIIDLLTSSDEPDKPKEVAEARLCCEIEKKWGDKVPKSTVVKIFGSDHGLDCVDGFATPLSVAQKWFNQK